MTIHGGSSAEAVIQAPEKQANATPEGAHKFIEAAETRLLDLWIRSGRAQWVQTPSLDPLRPPADHPRPERTKVQKWAAHHTSSLETRAPNFLSFALRMNPRLDNIAETVRALENTLGDEGR